jgi:hypothetical protein
VLQKASVCYLSHETAVIAPIGHSLTKVGKQITAVVRRLYGAIKQGNRGKRGRELGCRGRKRGRKEKETLYTKISNGDGLVSVVWEVGLKHKTIPTRLLAGTATR